MSELTVYTDGACRGNPGPGGFAAIMFFGDRTVEVGGGELDTTNNRMELSGVLIALSLLKKPTRVVIYSDSQYVCKGVSQWMEKWKRNGWTLGSGTRKSKHQQRSPVKNVDLWQQIYDLVHKHNVTMRWVRGHNGDENNEWADEMSVAMIGRDGGLDNLWMRDTPKSRASAKLLSEILYL